MTPSRIPEAFHHPHLFVDRFFWWTAGVTADQEILEAPRTGLDAKKRGRNQLGDDAAFGRSDAPIPFRILSRYHFPVVREDHGLARMTHL